MVGGVRVCESGTMASANGHPVQGGAALSGGSDGVRAVEVRDGCMVARVEGESLRSVIATVDDYLMNLSVSEQLC